MTSPSKIIMKELYHSSFYFASSLAVFWNKIENIFIHAPIVKESLHLKDFCHNRIYDIAAKENPETIAVSGFLKFLIRYGLSLGVIHLLFDAVYNRLSHWYYRHNKRASR